MARETGNLKAKGKVVERKVIERADASVMWRSAATLKTHFAQKRAHLSGAQARCQREQDVIVDAALYRDIA